MKGLFQCPPRALPWAGSFCPFRACEDNPFQGVWEQTVTGRLADCHHTQGDALG